MVLAPGKEVQMDAWGVVTLIVGALIIGGVAALIDYERYTVAAAAASIGAFIGGFVASEYLGTLSNWGTLWYGVRIFPALIGGVVVAAAVVAVLHSFGGTLAGPTHHRPLTS